MTKEEAKSFIHRYKQNTTVSLLALDMLFNNGFDATKECTKDEFLDSLDEYLEAIKSKGKRADEHDNQRKTFRASFSKDYYMQAFDLAKEFAEMEPMDLVTLVGNEFYRSYYEELMEE